MRVRAWYVIASHSSTNVCSQRCSFPQIEKARQNGVLASFVADAQNLSAYIPPTHSSASDLAHPAGGVPPSFDYKFDAVFTNAALHWCKRDPVGVIKGVAGILKEGGRFVGEMGGYMNCVGKWGLVS